MHSPRPCFTLRPRRPQEACEITQRAAPNSLVGPRSPGRAGRGHRARAPGKAEQLGGKSLSGGPARRSRVVGRAVGSKKTLKTLVLREGPPLLQARSWAVGIQGVNNVLRGRIGTAPPPLCSMPIVK